MRKLVLIYSDNSNVFDEFTEYIQSRHPRIFRADESKLYRNYITNTFGRYKNAREHVIFIRKIRKVVTQYTDYVYNNIILSWLSNYDYPNQIVFLRVDNFLTMNRLKRKYKKPIVTTLLLVNHDAKFTKKELVAINNYKFDFKITRHNKEQLKKEAGRYMLKKAPIIHRYRE